MNAKQKRNLRVEDARRLTKVAGALGTVVFDPNEGKHRHPCTDCPITFDCDYGHCTPDKPLRCDDCTQVFYDARRRSLFGGTS